MQSRMLVVPALVAGVFFAGTAQAQDTNQLVLKMKDELDALKAEIEPLKAVLQGAVIAFNRSEKDGACPKDWTKFDPATGRFIVGAGITTDTALTDHPSLLDDAASAVGGEEKHKLNLDEMPSHYHGIRRTQGKVGDGKYPDWTVMGNQVIQTVGVSDNAGRDQPHNTMPPFVALYYCIKK